MQTAIATTQAPPRTGRPTLYRDEYCDSVVEYFQRPRPARTSIDDRILPGELPSLSAWGNEHGVSPQRISEWQNRQPAFAEACTRAKAIGAELLSDRALTGQYNAQYAAFYAKNAFGWRDRTEVETVTRVEDSESTLAMKRALEHATPDQLAALSTLVQQMLANAPASIER
tara:strand:+ start:987 stop:1499 length:513 start_codon:yes stop_codon:yes gene_type:complete